MTVMQYLMGAFAPIAMRRNYTTWLNAFFMHVEKRIRSTKYCITVIFLQSGPKKGIG